ncbi:peptidylprolyl isomerase [Balneola sp. MJW-20]|uniref:peptidylprolyl isomerase n=1 Tax=Gracilimonas aurantiaca TaxID=3234185 RepID=UPI003465DF9B
MHIKFTLLLPLILILSTEVYSQTNPQVADQIVAHVNDRVILKSEIDAEVADYMRQAQFSGQPISFSKDLWYAFLESQVNNLILLEKAQLDSVTVSDDVVNMQMDQRIQQLTQQAGSERALEQAFGKSIIQLKADFREDFREQIIAQKVQQNKISTINITRPEVKDFFDSIPTDSLPTIPEQVALSQIIKIPPVTGNARQQAFEFASQLRDSILIHGKSIEELARRHSDGPSANGGGLLPMMSLNELVPEYSAAASALKPGGISEVVETSFGFHVIKLKSRVGDRIETNHILIEIKNDAVNDNVSIEELTAIRDSIITGDATFSQMAKRQSDDPNTAPNGGKMIDPQIGERLIPINRLDPALYQVVLTLDEVGDISMPKSFDLSSTGNKKAYRIVRLDRRVPEHLANFQQDYDRLQQIALQEKRAREYDKWIKELRKEFYIEYKIPVPKNVNSEI